MCSQVTARIRSLAAECCEGRLVSIFEGGYKQKPLSACARAHVSALASLDDYCFAAASPAVQDAVLGADAAPAGSSSGGGGGGGDGAARAPLVVGSRVKGRYMGQAKAYPGVISKVRALDNPDLDG